jgi:hypothetical protein
MKKRGMYSARCFFKPCLIPTMSHALNRFNEGHLRAYPYVKEQTEHGNFGRNQIRNRFHGNSQN